MNGSCNIHTCFSNLKGTYLYSSRSSISLILACQNRELIYDDTPESIRASIQAQGHGRSDFVRREALILKILRYGIKIDTVILGQLRSLFNLHKILSHVPIFRIYIQH